MIESERINTLTTNNDASADFVVYWMQQSQRTTYNHALEYAIQKANEKNKPLLVYFGITNRFPEANLRHYQFMIQGLQQIQRNLSKKNIQFIARIEHPVEGVFTLAKNAAVVVTDCGYLTVQKEWRKKVADQIDCPLIQVESDVIVPVETASNKEEYAAYTLRPKIRRFLPKFLKKLPVNTVKHGSLDFDFSSINLSDIPSITSQLDVDSSVSLVSSFTGGEDQVKNVLDQFIKHHINRYDTLRNDPSKSVTSQLSPYLHFGHISPLYVALEVKKNTSDFAESFLEELIVRRELSMNFVHFNETYDSVSCLPSWAFESLKKHESDKREYEYTLNELEQADTHDPYWNAAQKEMMITGKMHGYMRMYWGKKILEWTETISKAFDHALYLNNKYELDGRDPNGFAGVAWCFGKHDRAWKERLIFGKVRYMNKAGLKRKGNMQEYVTKVEKTTDNIDE
jgi:deoxyribodipyrimidine photo-lyase